MGFTAHSVNAQRAKHWDIGLLSLGTAGNHVLGLDAIEHDGYH
jgi:hypothetical protein